MKLHHIGIFVKSIPEGIKYFNYIFKIKKRSKIIIDKNLGVKIQFIFDYDNNCFEIIEPYGKFNPVSKILSQKKNIINHLAYKTKKFKEKIIYLRNKGFAPITKPKKALAFKNKRVIFFLSSLNFIIELIES